MARRWVAAVAVAGLAVLAGVVVLLSSSAPAPRPVPIDFIGGDFILDSRPETFSVFAGCYEGGVSHVEVRSEGEESVTVLLFAAGERCQLAGAVIIPVTLERPLGQRQVIDGYNGKVLEIPDPE